MEDIQSWYEVPSIAHFCSLFRAAFSLVDFDIEELEEALLTDGAEDMGSSLIQDLIVRLLNGCMGTSDVSSSNYQMFLRRLFRQKFQDGKKNPFNSDVDFRFLPLRTKVEILHFLCDCRLEADDVMEVLKNLEADSLRVEPLGYDDQKAAYWYFYGTRLYKEENAFVNEEELIEKAKKKGKKRPSKEPVHTRGPWTVACFTEDDWRELCNSLTEATSKNEKILYRTLKEDFLPEIPNLFAEKERQQRKRMSDAAPRRASTRIEKLKQQREEQDRIVAVAIQAELLQSESNTDDGREVKDSTALTPPEAPLKPKSKKIDEDEWLMLRNKADRATRALLREISRDNVDLFSSFESTKSFPARTSSEDSAVIDKIIEKHEKIEPILEKAVKKEVPSIEKSHKTERSERSLPSKPLKTKQESENKSTKKPERSEKHVVERSDIKSGRSANSGADTSSATAKGNNKKGRQTNNSLSSVIDHSSLGHLENGGVKYRRVTAPLSANTDEAKIGMYKILEQIKNHPDAWPFLDPVDEDFAPDYYTKISQPMDLEKMEQRVSTKYYQSVNEFLSDFDLIVDNCKKYNGPESEYSFMVDSLADEFRVLSTRYLNSVYEKEEPIMSGSESDCSTASDESHHHKRKVLDPKKRGGLMKLAQAFSASGNRPNNKSSAASKVKLKTEDVWDTPSPDSSETEIKNRKPPKSKDKVDKKKSKHKKPVTGPRNLEALNALAAATEQTLKDMNKWLDDTPKFPDSSANSSPGERVTTEEFETISESVEEEYRKQGSRKTESSSPAKSPKKNKSMQHKKKGLLILANKGRLPPESKEERDLLLKRRKKKIKKDKLMDSLFETPCDKGEKEPVPPTTPLLPLENGKGNSSTKEKDRPPRKTFDRLQQGGKSKLSKVSRPDESKLSSVIAKIKESRSSALQRQTEISQKGQLSLGTVLLSEIGSNKTQAEEKEVDAVEDVVKPAVEEEQPVETDKPTEEVEPKAPEPVVDVKHSATPNLSAWFKAFGAPKNPIKRQVSETLEARPQAPPVKKGIAQQQESGHKDLPWYARLEKKEPASGRLEPVNAAAREPINDENASEENRDKDRHFMDPSSPADSLGSLNSPASAESIKSPSTPGGWGGPNNRYSAADNPAIRSPLTPETQSFSPSVTPLHPIKVGFYQDMQALKGASPSHVKSPSCHSNSSGTGPNSPNDHALQSEPIRVPVPLAEPHHQLQQQPNIPQPVSTHHVQSSFQPETSQRLQGELEKQTDSYPLKKRSTPSLAHSSPSPIVTPTPIHANRQPVPPAHDPRAINQSPAGFNNFNPADYSANRSGLPGHHVPPHHQPQPPPQQQQQQPPPQQQHHHQQDAQHGLGQFNQYPLYGQNVANPLPGNLASLSQIVARIPGGSTGSQSSNPEMTQAISNQPPQQQHQSKRSHAQQAQQQQQQLHQQQHQQQQQHQSQQQQQQAFPNPMTTNLGYAYPSQSIAVVSSAERAGSLASTSPAFSGSQMSHSPATSSSVSSSRTSGGSLQNPPSHMLAYNNPAAAAVAAAAGYSNQPGVFYPQNNPGYRGQQPPPPQQTQQHHQTSPVQQQQPQQQPPAAQQQQQSPQVPQQQSAPQQPQSRPSQVFHHGAPLNSFEPGNHNFMWNSRPEQIPVSHPNPAVPTSNPPYGRGASGSNPFPSSLGYDPHHHHHMGGSLLFSGLDPLGGNPSMFSRNPLVRPGPPWPSSLSLDANMSPVTTSSRSHQQQQQQHQQQQQVQHHHHQQQQQQQQQSSSNSSSSQSRNSHSREKSRSAASEPQPTSAPGSAFNYNMQGLAPTNAPSVSGASVAGNDALSASLYERHRSSSQAPPTAPSLPPPAHQGSSISTHHQYPTTGNHHFGPSAGLNMAPTFGEFQPPPSHPHHPLAEHAQSSALYQQLLQQHRQQEELLLRNPHHPPMMLHQPGLLGSPAPYPPTFSSGLGLQQPFQGWL